MYSQSAREHSTLDYFRGLLHHNTVNADVKKAVDANFEFLFTVFKGHILACACLILEISSLDSTVHPPPALMHTSASQQQQYQFVQQIASQVVEQCTLINTCEEIPECDNKTYNYARVLCHYSALNSEMLGQKVMGNMTLDVGDFYCHTLSHVDKPNTVWKH